MIAVKHCGSSIHICAGGIIPFGSILRRENTVFFNQFLIIRTLTLISWGRIFNYIDNRQYEGVDNANTDNRRGRGGNLCCRKGKEKQRRSGNYRVRMRPVHLVLGLRYAIFPWWRSRPYRRPHPARQRFFHDKIPRRRSHQARSPLERCPS